MAASQQKRGERNREIDPLLARALDRLNAHIKEEGISQTALGEATGLKQGHISKLLNGKSPEASFYLIAKLATAARASIDWLIAPTPAPAPLPPSTGARPESSRPPARLPSKTG